MTAIHTKPRFPMTIGGESVAGTRRVPVINPATGSVFDEAPDCTSEQLDAAVAAAGAAFSAWRADLGARREFLKLAGAALKDNLHEIAAVLTAEQGKPLNDARIEILGCRRWLRYFSELELPREVIQDDEAAFVEIVRRPIGPTAAITAWNFPLTLFCWKVGPALLAGNTVVVKPSPYTPLSTLMVGALFARLLPPGVLNVVSGGDGLGSQLVAHPGIRKVAFTGSTGTGSLIAGTAGQSLKRVTLELGGNDAAIVLDDADPAAIAEPVFWGAFTNCGQICVAIKRLYVPDGMLDALTEALVHQARSVRVGDGAEDDTQLGPLNNASQRTRIVELVDDARRHGASVVAGGHPLDRPGYFYAPTLLRHLSDGVRVVDEEQFGPVLPIIGYSHLDAAIEAANGTEYGLGASVWGTDLDRARAVASKLEAGSVFINSHNVLQPHQPFGGLKSSGIGVENGLWGVHSFTDIQVLYEQR